MYKCSNCGYLHEDGEPCNFAANRMAEYDETRWLSAFEKLDIPISSDKLEIARRRAQRENAKQIETMKET